MPVSAIDNFVEFVDQPKARDESARTFTRRQQLPSELLREEDPNARRRFASAERQTVLEETRAPDNGLTRNRSMTLPEKSDRSGSLAPGARARQAAPAPKTDNSLERFEHGDLELGKQASATTPGEHQQEPEKQNRARNDLRFPDMSPFGLERGRSTFSEVAPQDIRIGQMTALNTDRFLYYSFYERAQELVYHHWTKYVRAVLYSYQRSGAATGDELWVTRIEIVLDRKGRFVRGLVHQGSGLQGLDLAPVHAFRDVKQIPHPPAEMVQSDGLVHMDWEFAVQMIPQLARGP